MLLVKLLHASIHGVPIHDLFEYFIQILDTEIKWIALHCIAPLAPVTLLDRDDSSLVKGSVGGGYNAVIVQDLGLSTHPGLKREL